MSDCNPLKRPTWNRSFSRDDPLAQGDDLDNYRQVCGSILWASLCCFPQISAMTAIACRFVNKPTEHAVQLCKKILRYMKHTAHDGVCFTCNNPSLQTMFDAQLQCYSDASWADDVDDSKSTTGYVIMLANGPIDWSSRLQKSVAKSTAESVLRIVSSCHGSRIFSWIPR